jgi:predicted nucleic acid-binding protein
MKIRLSKLFRKKEKKREKLPKYDIDSSIFLEIIFENPREDDAKKLFQLSGYKNKYRLVVSSIVIGEVLYVISKEKSIEYKEKCIEALKRLILYYDIEIYRSSHTALSRTNEVIKADKFIKSMDALIFACVLENKSQKFITFDSDFLDNKSLKEKFKEVKINDKI